MTATTTGPDFVSFQVRDREASARFYEETIGLTRLPAANPTAVVFAAGGGVAFAVRDPFPGVDLDRLQTRPAQLTPSTAGSDRKNRGHWRAGSDACPMPNSPGTAAPLA